MSGSSATRFARQGATATQLRAVYSAMRILAEDDRERGIPSDTMVVCDACHRDRPALGSVDYSGVRLCNGCATDYEVLRIARLVDTPAEYLGRNGGAAARLRRLSAVPALGPGARPHPPGSSRR